MFDITAHQNPFLRLGQTTMQAVLSLKVATDQAIAPAPLALGIALDRSGSMDGSKIRAARDGAIGIVQALDETIAFVMVAFSDRAETLFGPALGTKENKQRAVQMMRVVTAAGGTAMSTALSAIADTFGQEQSRAKKVLLLTDGKNESEHRAALDRAVARCAAANISVSAWGVGADWDEKELRYIADQTRGDADIIPTPQQIGAAFAAAFSEMRKTALTDVQMHLWSPVGVTMKQIAQVYPQIVPLVTYPDPASPRQQIVSLGSFAAGDQRDYLIDLDVPAYAPGQQFLMVRPLMKYYAAGTGEEKSERKGWVFAQWTEDAAQAAQIDDQVAHYTNQEELSESVREGQEALARGDDERATRLLGHALVISQRSGNAQMTKLLSDIVSQDANGTVRLNKAANAISRKTLAINAGKTSKLK
jgi:Ca-activated chloride channel family protein